MIRHAWTVVCEKIIIDRETNNFSLDILEQLNLKIPSTSDKTKGIIYPIKIEIASLWYRHRNENGIKGSGQLVIEAPNQEIVNTTKIDIDLTGNHRTRTRVRLDGLPIPKNTSGIFYFVMSLESNHKWTEVARIPLEVNIEYLVS